MFRIFLFIGILTVFLSCGEKNNNVNTNSPTIDYSFFIAGHAYGEPGVRACLKIKRL